MRNLCFLLTLVATLLLPGRLIAAALPQDEKLITGQLDNGLRYMIYPHAQPKDQVNLWLQIHTGSLQEEDNERGVAHFVEHMMFNGTKTWPGNKVIETFESMGLRFGRVAIVSPFRSPVGDIRPKCAAISVVLRRNAATPAPLPDRCSDA